MALSTVQRRDIRLLAALRGFSMLGDEIALITLYLRVAHHGQGWMIAALLIAGALPLVALSPIAGAVVDRVPAKSLAGAALPGGGARVRGHWRLARRRGHDHSPGATHLRRGILSAGLLRSHPFGGRRRESGPRAIHHSVRPGHCYHREAGAWGVTRGRDRSERTPVRGRRDIWPRRARNVVAACRPASRASERPHQGRTPTERWRASSFATPCCVRSRSPRRCSCSPWGRSMSPRSSSSLERCTRALLDMAS